MRLNNLKKYKRLIIGTALLLLPLLVFSQSKKELEEKRKRLLKEIEHTNQLLKKTTKTKESTLDRFVALQSKIEQRETLIQTLTEEINESESSIARTANVVNSLTRDVNRAKDEYGRMMRSAYRRKMTSNPLLYIFSADNLNQLFRRFLFLRKYDHYRKEQAEAIAFTKIVLAKKMINMEETRKEKEDLLASIQGQKSTLVVELTDKNNLLENLKKDETRLQSELKDKEKAHEQMNRIIEKVIQEEVRKKIEAERKPKPKPAEPIVNTAPSAGNDNSTQPSSVGQSAPPENSAEEDPLSADFRKNKGKLPWPVSSGFIAKKYGRQQHPTIPSIEITNNGIDIRTDDMAQVKSVFDGKVAGVQFIPGHDYTLIIQHGNYYTVYSNLREVLVAKGDNIRTKQTIGTVSTNNITGSSELHFELWNQKDRVNPTAWIKKG